MSKLQLERHQLIVYLIAAGLGVVAGQVVPLREGLLDMLLWPLLAVLLYAVFVQLPLSSLAGAIKDGRFLVAAFGGNFIVIPLLAWLLTLAGPEDPAVRLGILLVLLVPCTDWFIAFTHLGRGDTARAVAFTPLSLLLQLLLLPFYLWLFLGETFMATVVQREVLSAFFLIIVLPLVLAGLTRMSVAGGYIRSRVVEHLAWWPVPLLGAVILLIAAGQSPLVTEAGFVLLHLILVFMAFLVLAALLARVIAGLFRLGPAQGRTLAFSFGTRNSFVMLPIALALPAGYEITVVVIVFQSLIELLGMIAYLRWIPGRLFDDKAAA